MSDLRISEIFGPTIQGEGALIGLPTVFVRTGGCDYRCSWCDSLHAVDSEYRDQWLSMTTDAVWRKVTDLSDNKPIMVTLSGGNPAIQPFGPMIKRGHDAGYKFALETQGSVSKGWFADLDMLVLSPKPPSSDMAIDWDMFDDCLIKAGSKPKTVLKIVIFDDTDYDFAKQAAKRYPHLPIYLQPGNDTTPPADEYNASIDQDQVTDKMLWLIDKVSMDQWFNVYVLPQLHVMLWGNKRGV
jgi:7-carboxy-7-deazaguanine synthase